MDVDVSEATEDELPELVSLTPSPEDQEEIIPSADKRVYMRPSRDKEQQQQNAEPISYWEASKVFNILYDSTEVTFSISRFARQLFIHLFLPVSLPWCPNWYAQGFLDSRLVVMFRCRTHVNSHRICLLPLCFALLSEHLV